MPKKLDRCVKKVKAKGKKKVNPWAVCNASINKKKKKRKKK
jgi:hypothetical protein